MEKDGVGENLANKDGKLFENDWKKSIPKDMYYQRIKDNPTLFGNKEENNSNLRFTPKQPFDAFLFHSPCLYCFELKSTKGTSISFKGTSPMIKEHQIKELSNASTYNNCIAGFIFNFREPQNIVYFQNIKDFNNFLNETTKSSINQKDIINYGGLIVEGEIKKVRWKYNINKMVDDLNKILS